MNTARLRVVLRGVEPAVARVIDVPASATLPELHELLQAAIGWTDSHLHQFVTPQATYGMEIPGQEVWPEDQRDETGAQLTDLGTKFEYLYDFGDGWTHAIEVLGPGGDAAGCLDGEGAWRRILRWPGRRHLEAPVVVPLRESPPGKSYGSPMRAHPAGSVAFPLVGRLTGRPAPDRSGAGCRQSAENLGLTPAP